MMSPMCSKRLESYKLKNKYIERNLCVTLVIYQESLRDARSTKCKIIQSYFIMSSQLQVVNLGE